LNSTSSELGISSQTRRPSSEVASEAATPTRMLSGSEVTMPALRSHQVSTTGAPTTRPVAPSTSMPRRTQPEWFGISAREGSAGARFSTHTWPDWPLGYVVASALSVALG
jgi:hypothetical protein